MIPSFELERDGGGATHVRPSGPMHEMCPAGMTLFGKHGTRSVLLPVGGTWETCALATKTKMRIAAGNRMKGCVLFMAGSLPTKVRL